MSDSRLPIPMLWAASAVITAMCLLVFTVIFWPREASMDEKLAVVEDLAKARDLIQSGFKKQQRGQRKAALEEYSQALDLYPDFPRARFLRASIYLDRGEFAKAEEELTLITGDFTDPARSFNSRGAARVGLGDLEGALEDFSAIIELDADSSRAYTNRALVRKWMGDIDGAINDFSRALELKPEDPYAWDGLGVLYYEQGDLVAAREHFDKAVAASTPERVYANAFKNRAVLRREQGDERGAAQDMKRYEQKRRIKRVGDNFAPYGITPPTDDIDRKEER